MKQGDDQTGELRAGRDGGNSESLPGENFYSPSAVIASLLGLGDGLTQMIVREFRMPRVLVALFDGMALGIAGDAGAMLTTFRAPLKNPLRF